MNWLAAVHLVHVMSAVVWMGGLATMTLVVWPGLLNRPAAEAKVALMALGPRVGLAMSIAGLTMIVTGVLRGTVWGPLQSWEALLSTGYGHGFLAALGMALFIVGFGGWARGRMAGRLWASAGYRPGGARFVHTTNGVMLAAALLILVCMVRLRFGG